MVGHHFTTITTKNMSNKAKKEDTNTFIISSKQMKDIKFYFESISSLHYGAINGSRIDLEEFGLFLASLKDIILDIEEVNELANAKAIDSNEESMGNNILEEEGDMRTARDYAGGPPQYDAEDDN